MGLHWAQGHLYIYTHIYIECKWRRQHSVSIFIYIECRVNEAIAGHFSVSATTWGKGFFLKLTGGYLVKEAFIVMALCYYTSIWCSVFSVYVVTPLKENRFVGMGGACNTHRINQKWVRANIWSESVEVKGQLEDVSIDGRIILKRILKK
jgi:hypothetical protein